MRRIVSIGLVLCVSCVPLVMFSNSIVDRSNYVEAQRGTVYTDEEAVKCQEALLKANVDAKRISHFPAYLRNSEVTLLNHQVEDKCNVGKHSISDLGSFGSDIKDRQEAKRDSGPESRDH